MGMSESQKSEITASLIKIARLLQKRSDLEKLLSHVRQASQRLADARADVEEYRTLAIILQEAQNRHLEPQQFEDKIRETPFASLVEILPKSRADLYAFVALLLTVLQIIISPRTSSNAPTITADQVEKIIESVLEDHQHYVPPSVPPPSAPPSPPVPPADHK